MRSREEEEEEVKEQRSSRKLCLTFVGERKRRERGGVNVKVTGRFCSLVRRLASNIPLTLKWPKERRVLFTGSQNPDPVV